MTLSRSLHIHPLKQPHNVLSKGMIFYEVETKIDYKTKRFDVKILREYIVSDNENGKVTTLCIHHCENYITSTRTDWKNNISRQFKEIKCVSDFLKH